MRKRKTIALYLSTNLIKAIKEIAIKENRSISNTVETILKKNIRINE